MGTVPASLTSAKHRSECPIYLSVGVCGTCENNAERANFIIGWTGPTHRAGKHSHPHSPVREMATNWPWYRLPTHRRDESFEVAS